MLKTTKKKKTTVRRPKFADERWTGPEPKENVTITNGGDTEYSKALGWYNYYYDTDQAKTWLLEYLKKNNGIFVFIDSEYTTNPELREFGIGAQILKKLGIENINLLSTTKRKDYVGLSGFGLNIHQEIVL